MDTNAIHIDDWLYEHKDHNCPIYKFFDHKRCSASYQWKNPIQTKLFATYEGKEYRVTGASRMGDVYLSTDFQQSVGYTKRGVGINELSNMRIEE